MEKTLLDSMSVLPNPAPSHVTDQMAEYITSIIAVNL